MRECILDQTMVGRLYYGREAFTDQFYTGKIRGIYPGHVLIELENGELKIVDWSKGKFCDMNK